MRDVGPFWCMRACGIRATVAAIATALYKKFRASPLPRPGRFRPLAVMYLTRTALQPAWHKAVTILVTAGRKFCHPGRHIMTIDIYLTPSR